MGGEGVDEGILNEILTIFGAYVRITFWIYFRILQASIDILNQSNLTNISIHST